MDSKQVAYNTSPRRSEDSELPLLPAEASETPLRPHFCGRGGAGNFCELFGHNSQATYR